MRAARRTRRRTPVAAPVSAAACRPPAAGTPAEGAAAPASAEPSAAAAGDRPRYPRPGPLATGIGPSRDLPVAVPLPRSGSPATTRFTQFGVASAHLRDSLERGVPVPAGRRVGRPPAPSVAGLRPRPLTTATRLRGGIILGPLGWRALSAMSSHAPDQLPPRSSSNSRNAWATASGYSIIATCPASGSVSSRESRKAADALRAIRYETSWSRPPYTS